MWDTKDLNKEERRVAEFNQERLTILTIVQVLKWRLTLELEERSHLMLFNWRTWGLRSERLFKGLIDC